MEKNRLIIKKIRLENFKSYYGVHEIGDFHPNFSSVIGPNGSGKSNLIDSMVFIFGKRASWMRLKHLRELIHNSAKYGQCNKAQVSVVFTELNGNNDEVQDSEFTITRYITQKDESGYKVNNNKATLAEVTSLLKSKGVDLDNNRFMILQGEVEQISLMKPKTGNPDNPGYLEYLEDIIGTNIYVDEIEDLQKKYDESLANKLEKTETFKIIESEMKELTANKDETVKFLKKEKEVFQLKNLNHQVVLSNIRKKIDNLKLEKTRILDEEQQINESLQEYMDKNKHILEKRKGIQESKQVLEKQMNELKTAFDEYSDQYKKKQDELTSLIKEKAEIEQQNEKFDEKLSRMIDNEGETLNEIETIKTLLSGMDSKKNQAQDEVSNLEAKYSSEIREINIKKNKIDKEALELTKRIGELEELISTELGDKETAENSLNDNIAFKERCLIDIKEKEQALDKFNKDISNLSRTEATIVEKIEKTRDEQKEISQKLRQMEHEKNALEHRRNERRGIEDQTTRADRVYNELLNAQATGKLRGIRGKAGELLSISKEYDKAASTAGRTLLTRIVVDRFIDGQAALDYLRKYKIGQASFIALDKIPNFSQAISAPFRVPENTKRIFDLVSCRHEGLKNLAYFVFRDTLWAPNLAVANNVAFGSPQRKRVVTKDGDLIEPSGLFSGNSPAQGLIKLTNSQQNMQEESIDSLNDRFNKLNEECAKMAKRKFDISKDLDGSDNDLRFVKSQIENFRVEQRVIINDLEELKIKLENTENEILSARHKLSALENSSNDYKRITKEVEDHKSRLMIVEKERSKLIEKFRSIGGAELANKRTALEKIEKEDKDLQEKYRQFEAKLRNAKAQQTKIKEQKVEIEKEKEHINKEIDKIKLAKDNIEQISTDNYSKQNELTEKMNELDQQLEMLTGELGEFNKFIKDMRNKAASIKKKAFEKETDITEFKNKYRDTKNALKAVRKDYESILLGYDFISALKDIGALDENFNFNNNDDEVNDDVERRSMGLIDWKKYFIVDVFNDYTSEDIEFMADKSQEIDHKIIITEEKKNLIHPNLSNINVFIRKYTDFKNKESEMNEIRLTTEEIKEKLENLKEKRKIEFLEGFNIIAKKLKETYQLLTKGGDAELEPIDCADPFSEGILFSVRPPQKSWKQMSKLSGGEKTLSSLSLVYALHYYKPNPVYFMDEIDAALDYKNVSIVAKYTKEKTKNAQFIVISLRNNMYEQADKLIGIYKTYDTTKTVILEPAKMLESIAVIGGLTIEEEKMEKERAS